MENIIGVDVGPSHLIIVIILGDFVSRIHGQTRSAADSVGQLCRGGGHPDKGRHPDPGDGYGGHGLAHGLDEPTGRRGRGDDVWNSQGHGHHTRGYHLLEADRTLLYLSDSQVGS
jgi:hypothetical protein